MTAPPVAVTLDQPTVCFEDLREKGVRFQRACSLCRESYKTQVWLRFLLLSFLIAYTCAASEQNIGHIKKCLSMLRIAIEKSDAMLYAPYTGDIQENCKSVSLKCYMLELRMVMDEEEIADANTECISDFDDSLTVVNSAGCPPCEAYSLRNITIFLENLNHLLEEMASDNT